MLVMLFSNSLTTGLVFNGKIILTVNLWKKPNPGLHGFMVKTVCRASHLWVRITPWYSVSELPVTWEFQFFPRLSNHVTKETRCCNLSWRLPLLTDPTKWQTFEGTGMLTLWKSGGKEEVIYTCSSPVQYELHLLKQTCSHTV